jgi:hypothetical protein
MWCVFIKSKDEALDALNKIRASMEIELNLQVRALRTDRGGEFTSKKFVEFCDQTLCHITLFSSTKRSS